MTDLLAPSGKSAKFDTVGKTYKGVVLSREQRQQKDMDGKPKFWDNGDAMMEVVIAIQTDEKDTQREDATDDGMRMLYVRGAMLKSVREAVAKAGAPTVEVGGMIAVKYTGDGTPSKPGFSAPKQYVAQYVRPTTTAGDMLADAPAAAESVTADDLI